MKRIRFLGDRDDGSCSKRRQVKRACDNCRKGKRKCHHDHHHITNGALSHEQIISEVLDTGRPALEDDESRRSIHGQPQEAVPSPKTYEEPDSPPPCLATSTAPFAGPSSAHSLLLSVCTFTNMPPTGLEPGLSRGLPRSRLLRPSFQDLKAPPSERRPGVAPGYLPFIVRAILPYLEIECLQILPPQDDLDILIQIFKQEIHPILPIVDFTTEALSEPPDREKPATVILRQAICLAVCKNVSARQHLNLPEGESGQISFQKPRDFADKLFGALKIAMDIGLVDDRLELVQVLALTTFHSYGPDGDDEIARLCGQAVHYAYSSGLHHFSRPGDCLSEVRRVELLYSLFALDKIIAMTTGRPVIIRESDVYLPAEGDAILKELSPGLRLLFRLSQMLNQVLDLYGPRGPNEKSKEWEWEASWPEFEDLATEYELQTMQTPTQTCLELLYHTISVLSCRTLQSPTVETHTPEGASIRVDRVSKMRHNYSAQRISFLLGLETTMLPFIPYAASLSLTVALRVLQRTMLESTKRLARDDVKRNLRVLEELTEMYWHAGSASTIGRQFLQTLS